MTKPQSRLLLKKQLGELQKSAASGFSAGLIDDSNMYKWEILLMGPQDSLYEGGLFKAHLTFPESYPQQPPKMRFTSKMWHPNVHNDGTVCISILHAPGEDKYGYEHASERWLPIHTVESILISVISMLASPNVESPANVDAAKEYQNNKKEFRKKVLKTVRESQESY